MSRYQELGGESFFQTLVERFYADVAQDPLLRPLYPEEDLEPAARRLRLFLMQYFGGPDTYSQERGHPRLRMRHHGFPIGLVERDAWLAHMRHSLDRSQLPPELDQEVWTYFVGAADFMRNQS